MAGSGVNRSASPCMLPDMLRSVLILLCLAGVAQADPDAFDPVLDAPPTAEKAPDNRYEAPDPRAPGFMIGAFLGSYMGSIKSRLTEARSTLDSGARPFAGFGIGVRTRSPIEFGVDFGLGLGRTWSPKFGVDLSAFDLIIQPKIIAHVYESDYVGFFAGVGGETILFDVEGAGLNQAGIGPGLIAGILHRLGPHSLIFLEVTGTAFYDFLAYRFEDPTEAQLEEDPLAEPEKVEGEWYGVMRLTVGYRLTAF